MNRIKYYLSRFTWERFKFSINGFIALIVFIFMRKKDNIWVFGTGNGHFENNIQYFYNYCEDISSHGKEQYFVTNQKGLNIPAKILKKGSVRAYLKSLQAQVLIYDTGNSDIIPGFLKYAKGLKVNVSHGQEGLKRLSCDYYKTKYADLLCAVSDFEREIKITECGAMASNVFVTGQPRYDVVHEGSKDGDILFFFTWREGMQNMTNKELMASTYMKIIIETIKSPKIIDLLNQFDKKLYVKFHHMLPAVQLGFLNERVVLVDKTVNFTQIIKDCSALITDYSSVCWDYIYNNRPVIFYPFDFEEYSSSPGLYIDLVEDNTMNTVRSRGELEKQLEFILSNDATNSDNSSVSSKYFAHQDLNNCSRIYTQIQQLLNRN